MVDLTRSATHQASWATARINADYFTGSPQLASVPSSAAGSSYWRAPPSLPRGRAILAFALNILAFSPAMVAEISTAYPLRVGPTWPTGPPSRGLGGWVLWLAYLVAGVLYGLDSGLRCSFSRGGL